MARLSTARGHRSRRLALRLGAALAVPLLGAGVVVAACNGGSSTGSPSSISGPFCSPTPCTVGAICYLTMESNCNGEWYCWDDRMWHCAPPESGGPPDVGTPLDEDASDDADSAETEATDAADEPQQPSDASLDAGAPADG
ncbi:MAG: hypothetical protein ACLP1X_01500 [Polyangiaceae bacterium]